MSSAQRSPLTTRPSDLLEDPLDEVNGSRVPDSYTYESSTNGNGNGDARPNGDVASTEADYRGGLCLQCNQPVIGKVITALGGVWHPEHFACAYCQVNVVNDFFYEHDGSPYCTECHLSLFAPKCAFCGEAITDVS